MVADAETGEATCPRCHESSPPIHSYYSRSPRDLPSSGRPVRLVLHVRRFRCQNPACSAVTFGERLPSVVAPSAVGLGMSLVLVVLSVAVALFISQHISVPLSVLAGATRRVSQGDLSQRVSVSNKDEIGELAQAFNQMTQSLETTMASQVAKEYLEGVINRYKAFIAHITEGDLSARLSLNGDGQTQTTNEDLHQLGLHLNAMVERLAGMTQQTREAAASVAAASAEILAATTQQIASATEQDTAVTQTMSTVEEVRMTVKQTAERA